jgi:hypothetical protein
MAYRTRDNRIDLEGTLDRLNRRLTAWVLGTGLLSFHAGVFFLTMTGLFVWNAYESPSDFWAADVLRRWGAVLTLHAVVVIAATVGWRLLRTADIQEASMQRWRPALGPGPTEPTVANWRAIEGPRPTEPPLRPPGTEDVPRVTAAQRFRSRAAERLATMRGKENEDAAVRAQWPEPPTRRDPEADELIRQFGPGAQPDEESVARRPRRSTPARWSWVEASATKWLTKKETPDAAPEREPRVAAPAPPPAAPADDDEPFAL